MFMIPVESIGHTRDLLVVILDDTSLARMAKADPAEIILQECGKTLVNPRILLCHENPSHELRAILSTRDPKIIEEHLRRGFEFRPDLGDHDNGPQMFDSSGAK